MNLKKGIATRVMLVLMLMSYVSLAMWQETKSSVKVSEDSGPTKRALLVGINDYSKVDGFNNLLGCENDVARMQALLNKFGFEQANILPLLNSEATHDGILDAFEHHLINKSKSDDIVVFYFSGHGARMPDVSGDEDDNRDETIVPADSRDAAGKHFDISDDQLNGLIHLLSKKTNNITLIFDSCHSGSVNRGSALARSGPDDKREPPDNLRFANIVSEPQDGVYDLFSQANEKFALISGCASNQNSYEYEFGDHWYGALTYHLTEVLDNPKQGLTYKDVMDVVAGKVNAKNPKQEPQLQGHEKHRYVFSDSAAVIKPYILAYSRGKRKVRLTAGGVHGFTKGSGFDIYAPGTRDFHERNQPVTHAVIDSVAHFESFASLVDADYITNGSRAIEREHHYEDRQLYVAFRKLVQSPLLQTIKDSLSQYPFIKTMGDSLGYNLLVLQSDNEIVLEAGDTTRIGLGIPVNETTVDTVVKRVKEWTKWFHVLSIDNSPLELPIEFKITTLCGGKTRSPFSPVGKPEYVLTEGENLTLTVHNKSQKSLYFGIIDLSTDGSIDAIYQSQDQLAPGKSWSASTPTYLPPEKDLDSVTDILKLFVSTKKFEMDILKKPALRRGDIAKDDPEEDEVTRLLKNATGRGEGMSLVKRGNWATAQRVIKVVKAEKTTGKM